MIIIHPYKAGSKSVKALKEAGVGVELRLENSKFKGAAQKRIVNWGSSVLSDEAKKCRVLNNEEAVRTAGDKLAFFTRMGASKLEDTCVPFTEDIGVVKAWLADGIEVVARKKLKAHSGEGIELFKQGELIPVAPLYTMYIPKKQEYRVHVVRGKVIDIQRKARKKEVADEKVNWKVRNIAGGFIYARDFAPEDLPRDLENKALAAVEACGLDFGAVDIIYNDKQKRSYVLEINTAPGLQGTTLDAYVQAFKDIGFIFEV